MAEMEFLEGALHRGPRFRLEPAIHNLELLKIKKRGNGGLAAPPIADHQKIIVGRRDITVWLFGFDIVILTSRKLGARYSISH